MVSQLLDRFTFFERIIHWIVGITFVLLLFTGLAFSHPSLFWLTTLLGGGPSARVLHPWIGAVFSIGMCFMILIWVRDMFLDEGDRRWLGAVRHYAMRETDKVPPAGKYNAGQKMFFWFQAIFAIAHLASGVPLWFPAGFDAAVLQWMRVVHYVVTPVSYTHLRANQTSQHLVCRLQV